MIAIVSGTNRPKSRSRVIAGVLEKAYREAGVEARVLDLHELPLELFSPEAYSKKPESFEKQFIEPILQAQGVHFVTPEYNGSFPGALKYFIDMLPFPASFEARPMALTGISSGRFGALRPVEQLQMVLGYRNAFVYPQRVFIASASQALGAEGVFADPALRERLEAQARGFAAFARKFSPGSSEE